MVIQDHLKKPKVILQGLLMLSLLSRLQARSSCHMNYTRLLCRLAATARAGGKIEPMKCHKHMSLAKQQCLCISAFFSAFRQ